MSEPMVVAVMLTKNRPLMALRALKAFRAQTYKNKQLLVLDNSDQEPLFAMERETTELRWVEPPGRSIGEYRNRANKLISDGKLGEIVMHWDDDDWSHPARMAEQVKALQGAESDVIGYRNMLFWRTEDVQSDDDPPHVTLYEDAWTYTNRRSFCVGTSLCYWLSTWKGKPFPLNSNGEDTQWIMNQRSFGLDLFASRRPRMIAAVHGHNTTTMMKVAMKVGEASLKRTPEWDEYCRREMAL